MLGVQRLGEMNSGVAIDADIQQRQRVFEFFETWCRILRIVLAFEVMNLQLGDPDSVLTVTSINQPIRASDQNAPVLQKVPSAFHMVV